MKRLQHGLHVAHVRQEASAVLRYTASTSSALPLSTRIDDSGSSGPKARLRATKTERGAAPDRLNTSAAVACSTTCSSLAPTVTTSGGPGW